MHCSWLPLQDKFLLYDSGIKFRENLTKNIFADKYRKVKSVRNRAAQKHFKIWKERSF